MRSRRPISRRTAHAGTFRGDAQVSTWLTRIVINQALMRLRRQKRDRVVVPFDGKGSRGRWQAPKVRADERSESPAASTLRAELRRLLERRIDELPATFRTVFVMRDVEEMSVQETAELLGIPPPPCARGSSARVRCCARPWRATSTRQRSMSSPSPASAATASSLPCWRGCLGLKTPGPHPKMSPGPSIRRAQDVATRALANDRVAQPGNIHSLPCIESPVNA